MKKCDLCGKLVDEDELFGSKPHICDKCFRGCLTVDNVVAFADERNRNELPSELQDIFMINHFKYWHLKAEIGRLLNIVFASDVDHGRIDEDELYDYIYGDENAFAEFVADKDKKKSQPSES